MLQYEVDTWYDQHCRIVFAPSKGLVGVGLPSKANKAELKNGIHYRIEWLGDGPAPLDIPLPCTLSCPELPHWFVVIRTCPDETLPDAHGNYTVVERKNRYHAPFVKRDREKDYEIVWSVFAGDKDQ